MIYTIKILREVEKSLVKIDQSYKEKIRLKIRSLSENPRPHGTEKLAGKSNIYRIRVGKYRIIYEIFDTIVLIEIINVAHRKDVYRSL